MNELKEYYVEMTGEVTVGVWVQAETADVAKDIAKAASYQATSFEPQDIGVTYYAAYCSSDNGDSVRLPMPRECQLQIHDIDVYADSVTEVEKEIAQ